MSTATSVRTAIETAIKAIETDLGFTDGDFDFLHTHLLDHELTERRLPYVKSALAAGSKVTRAIGIEVLERETHDQLFANVVNRVYQITIEFYYDVGTDGSGVKTLIDHMRAVREAIKDMATELSGTVDRVESINQTRPTLRRMAGLEEEFLVAQIQMEALEVEATF